MILRNVAHLAYQLLRYTYWEATNLLTTNDVSKLVLSFITTKAGEELRRE